MAAESRAPHATPLVKPARRRAGRKPFQLAPYSRTELTATVFPTTNAGGPPYGDQNDTMVGRRAQRHRNSRFCDNIFLKIEILVMIRHHVG
jgi:hypothetical protein